MRFPDLKVIRALTGILIICFLQLLTAAKENAGTILKRTKRQFELEQGNQVIDSIFQIPIQTLTAVSNLWKTTRPITFRIRQQVLNQFQQYANRPGYYGGGGGGGGYYPSDSFTAFQRPSVTVQRPSFNYQTTKGKTKLKQKKLSLDIDE